MDIHCLSLHKPHTPTPTTSILITNILEILLHSLGITMAHIPTAIITPVIAPAYTAAPHARTARASADGTPSPDKTTSTTAARIIRTTRSTRTTIIRITTTETRTHQLSAMSQVRRAST